MNRALTLAGVLCLLILGLAIWFFWATVSLYQSVRSLFHSTQNLVDCSTSNFKSFMRVSNAWSKVLELPPTVPQDTPPPAS